MVDVQTEIRIAKPIDIVASYAMNPEHAPEWYVNIQSAVWQTPPPVQVGSKIAFQAQFLGRKLAYIYEVVELIPSEKLVMKTADGPFPMETTYTFDAVEEDTTRMTLRNRGNPKGFSGVFAPFMARMMRKANQKDLEMIKGILEGP